MPRNGSGFYTLPAGNPVVDATVIESTWANPTMSDIAVQLNSVITRDGILGPSAPIKFQGGSAALPGVTFSGYNNSGFYRSSTILGISFGGSAIAEFTASGMDLIGALTISTTLDVAGTSTFVDAHVGGDLYVVGSINLTSALPVASGGTGSTTASGARTNLGAAASGANTDITSLSAPSLGAATATTAAADTNTTQVASTQFVIGQATAATPLVSNGSGSVGTSDRYARGDHVHPVESASQTWQSVSRTKGGGYTNSTGKLIWLYVEIVPNTSYEYPLVVVGGITIKGTATASSAVSTVMVPIPNGAAYYWDVSSGTLASSATFELR